MHEHVVRVGPLHPLACRALRTVVRRVRLVHHRGCRGTGSTDVLRGEEGEVARAKQAALQARAEAELELQKIRKELEELRLQAQYGQTGLGVDEKIQQLPGTVSHLLDVVLERVERDLSTWASSGAVKGFNMARMLLGRSKAGGDEDRASTVVSIATGATGEEKGQEEEANERPPGRVTGALSLGPPVVGPAHRGGRWGGGICKHSSLIPIWPDSDKIEMQT